MCMICASRPNPDPLAGFDQHVRSSLGTGSGSGFGSGGQSAPYTWDQIADYLTDGYWTFNTESWRRFDFSFDPSRTLTYNTSFLSGAAQAIAEYALDVWAAATGINFVNVGVAPAQYNEFGDVAGSIASTFVVTTNATVSGFVGAGGDADFYRVTLEAGKSYVFGLAGASLDAVLTLFDASGVVVQEADDPDYEFAGEYVTFTATSTGTYFISAAGFDISAGAYELTVSEAADISFGDMDPSGAYSLSDLTGNVIDRSYININDSWNTLNLNGYMLQTYIHELGHALGLGHAGPYNGTADWPGNALYDNDSWSTTVMSYFDQTQNPFDPNDLAYLATIMPADIIAIQNLYGTGSSGYLPGDTVWGPGGNIGGVFQTLLDMAGGLIAADPLVYVGNPLAFTVYDTGGIDTVNASTFSMAQVINLNELTYSNVGGLIGNVIIARGVVIEHARGGSGSDTITGNNAVNNLYGNNGTDSIYGGNAGDNLWGGGGSDAHYGGTDGGIDYARYDDANHGNLMIRLDGLANSGAAAVGDTYSGIEGLVGGAGNDTVAGNTANNFLFGSGGADQIYGGTGNDYLSGDAGGDNLWGGVGADAHYGGTDTGIDYARYDDANHGNLSIRLDGLANVGAAAVGDTYSGIEGLVGGVGNDTVTGNTANNFLFGSGGADQIYGGVGNDYLSGDAGGDNLWGGVGADAHYGGTDGGIDYARYDDANHGNLMIRLDGIANTGAAAVGDTYTGIEGLVGGAGNDLVLGNVSNNYLFGSGGADNLYGLNGNDYLNGGSGADRFHFLTALSSTNVDTIADFQVGVDDMLLAQAIFSALGTSLTADEFRIGIAQDTDDFLLYNPGSGQLFYDSNANVAGGMVHFANVSVNTALTIADFIMV